MRINELVIIGALSGSVGYLVGASRARAQHLPTVERIALDTISRAELRTRHVEAVTHSSRNFCPVSTRDSACLLRKQAWP
ncbi:MAG: hypothetical protein O2884_13845, partial [Chloroflexi bacterium]|nr:hypothetical protein [Chloroflexota bacterium]